MILPVCAFLLNIFLFSSKLCYAIDHLTSTQFLKDQDTIISNNTFFRLGFFSLPNSTKRYVGIWYNHPSVREVIWVANRNNPLTDSSGVLKLSVDGNLIITNARNQTLWSSNVTNHATKFSVANLLDSGNLVIQGYSSTLTRVNGTVIWQSSKHATDTVLPNMTFVFTPNLRRVLQAWSSPSDPSVGRYSTGTDSLGLFQMIIYDGDKIHWRSGPWNGNSFIGTRYHYTGYGEIRVNAGSFIEQDVGGMLAVSYAGANATLFTHYVLTYEGIIAQKWWDDSHKTWQVSWHAPDNDCDIFKKCGEFGTCNPKSKPICSCLKGFKPKNEDEWRRGNWTSGCQRKKPLQCGLAGGTQDGFLKLKMIKVPENAEVTKGMNFDKCRSACLTNCSCLAFTYVTQIECMTWSGNLIDISDLSPGGVDLYLRLEQSELSKSQTSKIIIISSVATGTIIILGCIYGLLKWINSRYGNGVMGQDTSMHKIIKAIGIEAEFQELPLIKLQKLLVATNNFHSENKLGQGGFGPVYKGRLEDGQEVAVKRLSRASGQGQREFMSEVMVISKLQHKNLVRLLGCCVEGEEKLLVYEFMPKKSLDALLFDPIHREQLSWKTRFDIIKGICRGVLYLHRDSRVKIIHRDLKASNILLDEELNPKISDFGMARIFGGKQVQANTSRVVGTYGYMSPEYAMRGQFSEKSDVFSLGVLLIEIVSGRRNSDMHDDSISLISYVWKSWIEDNILSLIDPTIYEPQFQVEILRSIHIGLLCVQEFPEDRPTISEVIAMLESEVKDLPRPLQPGFTQIRTPVARQSMNNMTISSIHGR